MSKFPETREKMKVGENESAPYKVVEISKRKVFTRTFWMRKAGKKKHALERVLSIDAQKWIRLDEIKGIHF